MKVRFTPSAEAEFLAALNYIRQDNPSAALQFRAWVNTVLRRLEKFPQSGRAIPEFPDLAFREIIVAPYRFFYRVEGKTAWIVAVWHGARIPEEPLRKPSRSSSGSTTNGPPT